MYNSQGDMKKADKDILEICHEFYSQLYNKETVGGDCPYTFIPERDNALTLSSDEKSILSEKITLDELTAALKNMKKGKAPGLDGLTVDFYHELWDEVGLLVFNSLTYSKSVGSMTAEQRRGAVKLIPKKDKNPHFVRNLRPIILLNVDVKILTKSLAARFKTVIDRIVAQDQQAFIKERFLGNSVLDLYSLLAHAEEEDDKNLLLLSLDIEKAFDSVSWEFLYKLLEAYQVPQYCMDWIHLLHNGKELRVYNNGHSSPPFWSIMD